ncbi:MULTISPECIES: hypothetical protein [unclassified Gilliamella]|uniref:hypothetical protein n=1 Tax=unclassified Gilliamella TaxID=2685620 RepID=UPI00159ED46F|nr:hypothetical protein [Gilliamella apicola]
MAHEQKMEIDVLPNIALAHAKSTEVAGLLGMINGIDSLVAFGGLVALGGMTKGPYGM